MRVRYREVVVRATLIVVCVTFGSIVSAGQEAQPPSAEASFCQAALDFLGAKSRSLEMRRAAANVVKDLAGEPQAPAVLERFRNVDEDEQVRAALARALARLQHKEAAPVFSASVADSALSSALREAALRGLVALRDTSAVPQLKAALKSLERDERIFAAHCLSALRDRSGEATSVLMEELANTSARDTSSWSRIMAALGRLRDPAAIPGLIETMEAVDSRRRRSIHGALARITLCDLGSRHEDWAEWWEENAESFESIAPSKETAPILVAKLSGSRSVRPAVAAMLREIGDAALPALAAGLETPDANHDEIASLLISLGPPARPVLVNALGGASSVRQRVREAVLASGTEWSHLLLKSAVNETAPVAVRTECIALLGGMREASAAEALVELLEDEAAEVRCRSLEALAKISPKEMVGQVVGGLSSPDPAFQSVARSLLPTVAGEDLPLIAAALKDAAMRAGQKRAIVRALTRVSGEAATKLLCDCLGDDEPSVRVAAARSLGERGDKASIPALREVFKGRHVALLCAIAESLGKLDDAESIPRLGEYTRSQALTLANTAVAALGAISDPASTEALIEALDTFSDDVRVSIVKALQAKGSPEAIEALTETLKSDPEAKVKDAAALGLAGLKQTTAIPYLIDRLEKTDRWSQRTYLPALRDLTGQTELTTPDEWRDWLGKKREE